MPALIIIAAIIALIVAVFCIPVKVNGSYYDEFILDASWAFLKFNIIPMSMNNEKSPKKDKKPKKEEPEEEPENKSDESKENPFVTFYKNQGFDGVIDLINNSARILARFFKYIKNHFIIKKLYLYMTVTSGDAASTALKYGKTCQKVFPALGYICSSFPVRKYDVNIEPDYIANENKAEFEFAFSIKPITITNAVVALAFRMLFNVGIKFLKGIKSKKNKNINEGGALQ